MLSIISIDKKAWDLVEKLRDMERFTQKLTQKMQDPSFDVDNDPTVREFIRRANAFLVFSKTLPGDSEKIYRRIQQMSRIPEKQDGYRPSRRQRRITERYNSEEALEQRRRDRIVLPKTAFQDRKQCWQFTWN